MKKISIRKLGLKTQTIRDLAPPEMARVAGAGSFFCSALYAGLALRVQRLRDVVWLSVPDLTDHAMGTRRIT